MSAEAPTRRPGLLLPALLTVLGTVILCALGTWQLVRMGEKHVFLSRLTAQASQPPAAIPPAAEWPRLDPAALDLTRVSARGRFVDGPYATVRTTLASGRPGSRQLTGFGRWIFQGFALAEGGTILVNRGFVPEGRLREVAPASGEAEITGFLRAPEGRNAFTPSDMPAQRDFFTRDPAGIAAALGLTAAPFYLEQERTGDGLTPPAGVEVRELIERIPDNHLQYALTWYGLALTMLGVFGAFAWQRRQAGG